MDASIPLYERIKFLAIYSSNLEEFYRVRVASIRSLANVKKKKRKKLGLSVKSLLETIHQTVLAQQEEFGKTYREDILPKLAAHNVHVLDKMPDDLEQIAFARNFFNEEILPFVSPMILMEGKIKHFLRDRGLYFAVKMYSKREGNATSPIILEGEEQGEKISNRKPYYAIIRIPNDRFPRFIKLPSKEEGKHEIVWLDEIVRKFLDVIFPGFDLVACSSVKLSRDADLLIEDELSGDLVEKIKASLSKRLVGAPARFLYDSEIEEGLLKYLRKTFSLRKNELTPGSRHHSFNDLFGLPNPIGKSLENASMPPLDHPGLDIESSIFSQIAKKDFILHFPYQKYDYFLQFLREAALDPSVKEIHTTQYRVASDSAIVGALISAALQGKKVSVFVEIKARFDEASNLQSAEDMKAAGVNVVFSKPDIKVHAKVALAIREEEGKRRSYAFLSTGNFNEKTARIYADHGLLTANENLTSELMKLFGVLENNEKKVNFDHLLIARHGLREGLYAHIEREMAHAKAGKPAHIMVKLNNLEDQGMIDKLYEASQAGVKIDMLIRGICCLRPGVEGLSENIRIIRIVDRFLEHARVIVFHNLGEQNMYLGSADWMGRNLNRRIEVVFPIVDPSIKNEILHVIELQFQDNTKAVELDANMQNHVVQAVEGDQKVRAQFDTYHLIKSGELGLKNEYKIST